MQQRATRMWTTENRYILGLTTWDDWPSNKIEKISACYEKFVEQGIDGQTLSSQHG